MFEKKTSFLFLGIAVSVTLFIFFFRPNVVFDYDFESFFPQDDTELSFYQTFRNEFENEYPEIKTSKLFLRLLKEI
jgi:predicted RND superfamily exporter protein